MINLLRLEIIYHLASGCKALGGHHSGDVFYKKWAIDHVFLLLAAGTPTWRAAALSALAPV
jgi:hypothetical protein